MSESGTLAFSEDVLAFCEALSRRLLAERLAEELRGPVAALGFWLRRANMERIRAKYPEVRVGTGQVFHIPPSNVPTLMIYAWVSAMLAGNPNVVRVSETRLGATGQYLLNAVRGVLAEPRFRDLAAMNTFVTYGHDDERTQQLAAASRTALLWGNNTSIEHLKSLCAVAKTHVLSFPARYSALLLDTTDPRFDLDDVLLDRVWRDTHPFAQQACSSPKAVIWVGEGARLTSIREEYWRGMDERLAALNVSRVEREAWGLEQAHYWQDQVLVGPVSTVDWCRGRLRLQVPELSVRAMEKHPGCFSWLEVTCAQQQTLSGVLSVPLQTLGCWPPLAAEKVEALKLLNVLRAVPAGQALDFDVVWDGHDLIRELSDDASG